MKEIVGEPIRGGVESAGAVLYATVTGRFRLDDFDPLEEVVWRDVEIVLRPKRKDVGPEDGGFLIPMTVGEAVRLGVVLNRPEPDRFDLAVPASMPVHPEQVVLIGGPYEGCNLCFSNTLELHFPDALNRVPYRDKDGVERLGFGKIVYAASGHRDGLGRRVFMHVGPSPLKPAFEAIAADDPGPAPEPDTWRERPPLL